jgi:hypothetical protein
MFEIKCAGSILQKQLSNMEASYPPEVCQELSSILRILQRDGQFTRTDFYDINTNRISAATCYLFYRSDFEREEVLIIDLKLKPADVFKQRFKVMDDWDDKDTVESIPQYDDPLKIVQAVELIHRGTTSSYDLGYELGHRGKKEKYISRHGQYAKHTLEQLGLISRVRTGRQWLLNLTDKGRAIAEAPDRDLQLTLLIRAMLSYSPVWRIIVAVTEREGEMGGRLVLNDDLVKKLTFPEVLQSSDTSNRRSMTLKNWIKWISRYSGIPIWLNTDGIQLPIEMLYEDDSNDAAT